MKKDSKMSDNEKWQAVVNCDKYYDDIFVYGVKTTGIFCRPSCRSKTPARTNVVFFNNRTDAEEAGFRPCKKCRPDKIVYEPDLELVKKALDIFDADFNRAIKLNDISKELGISSNHLVRLFKRHSGMPPSQYITKLRVNKAAELLGQKEIDILEIAYMTGFRSLSNFYKCFKEQIGLTPKEFKDKSR